MTITGWTMPKVINVWTSLGLSYVLRACVSKDEFKSVNYAVRYLPDSFVEKNVPFNRLVSKNFIKWYTLRNIATRSSLESSSNYPLHLLNPRSKAIRWEL